MTKKKLRNEAKVFEAALAGKPRAERFLLRLYVTGTTPRSAKAIRNIRAICDEKLPGCYDLEVIDIYQKPELASQAQIVVAPTLVKHLPRPVRRLIGDLSNIERVLVGLDLTPSPQPGGDRAG